MGREHSPVITESKLSAWRKARGVSDSYRGCRWSPSYRWVLEGEVIPPDAIARKHGYSVVTGYRWTCGHSRVCDRCGKILDGSLRRDCPDFHERVP